MAKGSACFYCKNSTNARPDIPGWAYDCSLGIDNTAMLGDESQVVVCDRSDVRLGFQIGGHYSHMWFEGDGELMAEGAARDPCMTWVIGSDGEFAQNDRSQMMEFHICDFKQIENWVKFWGTELRRRGLVTEDEPQLQTGHHGD